MNSKSEVWHLVIFWLAVTSSAPFLFYAGVPLHPYKSLIATIVLWAIVVLWVRGKIRVRDKGLYACLFVQVLFFLIISIYHDSYTKVSSFFLQFSSFIVLYTYVQSLSSLDYIYKSYLYFMMTMAVTGATAFILSSSGLLDPLWSFPRPSSDDRIFSYGLTFTNARYLVNDFEIIRYAGFFDEPGRMGFYIVYALLLNKIGLDNKRYEIILILCGTLTLSLAFIFSVFLYTFVFYLSNNRFHYFLIVVLVLVLSGYGIHVNRDKSPFFSVLNERVVSRVMPASDGRVIQGNNRYSLIISKIEYFWRNPMLGNGPSFFVSNNIKGTSSIFNPLIRYGVIGTFFVFLPFIYCVYLSAIKRNSVRIFLSLIVVLGANYLQRPQVLGPLNFLSFALLAYVCSSKISSSS